MEAFPQVAQEGILTCVGIQENKILNAHPIPGCQRGLHVSQDLGTPFFQTLCLSSDKLSQRTKMHNKTSCINWTKQQLTESNQTLFI